MSTTGNQREKGNDEREKAAVELLEGKELRKKNIREPEGYLLDEEGAKMDNSCFLNEGARGQDAVDGLSSGPFAGSSPVQPKASAMSTGGASLEKRAETSDKGKEEVQGAKHDSISPLPTGHKEVINESGNEDEQLNRVEIIEEGRLAGSGGLPDKAIEDPEKFGGPGADSASADVVQNSLESEQRDEDDGNAAEEQRIASRVFMEKTAEELEQLLQNSTEIPPSAKLAQIGHEGHGESHGCKAIDGVKPASIEIPVDKTMVKSEQSQEALIEILSTTVANEVQNENGERDVEEPVKEGAEPKQAEEATETVTPLIADAIPNLEEHEISQCLGEPPLDVEGEAEKVQVQIPEAGSSEAPSSLPATNKPESEAQPSSSLEETTWPPTMPKIRKGHLASLLVLNPAYTLPSRAVTKPRRFFDPHKRKVMIGDESLERISIPGVKKRKAKHVKMMYQVLLVDKPQDGLRGRR
ncbi:Hypothetical Protein CGB_F1680C [Cryptococcus gattii WM276]|uniref:Uncharacterized protein n=1 Tax=Cryptococcus gattii serotype B (strain WM276 / ATCC MYA-4071) TaxID=367775 RepID=E6R7V7_CRYGW|nr:Hypothetical Protein CGB_F1680C [Cryptococcus gattii WM276]ADV22854.1 Hypothetical Protein CGB_F1680C [Cryptococcus gattii WM276]